MKYHLIFSTIIMISLLHPVQGLVGVNEGDEYIFHLQAMTYYDEGETFTEMTFRDNEISTLLVVPQGEDFSIKIVDTSSSTIKDSPFVTAEYTYNSNKVTDNIGLYFGSIITKTDWDEAESLLSRQISSGEDFDSEDENYDFVASIIDNTDEFGYELTILDYDEGRTSTLEILVLYEKSTGVLLHRKYIQTREFVNDDETVTFEDKFELIRKGYNIETPSPTLNILPFISIIGILTIRSLNRKQVLKK